MKFTIFWFESWGTDWNTVLFATFPIFFRRYISYLWRFSIKTALDVPKMVFVQAAGYVNKNSYLGFLLSSSLSCDDHVELSLRKFRKAIYSFKSSIKTRKRCLLVRFARTYIIPTISGLEFVEQLKSAYIQRFNFLLTKFFGLRTVAQLEELRKQHSFLYLENQHKWARQRYQHDF